EAACALGLGGRLAVDEAREARAGLRRLARGPDTTRRGAIRRHRRGLMRCGRSTPCVLKPRLAPSTIRTKVGLLAGFFEYLREEGQMTHQPVLRRRHRLLTPLVLPKPMPDAALTAFFQVIDAVRDRLIFLCMLRCGLRVSEVCALTWDAIECDASTVRSHR